MASITVKDLSKQYDRGRFAVRDVSLTVNDGELVCLVGPSGCGKSTLLHMIAGLEPVTSGSIHIGDRDVTHAPPGARDLAMVFQSYALYPHMTVRGNLAFPLDVAGLDRKAIARRVGETAERLGLGSLLDRRPGELSGGQRQRVALGRALVREPKAFLLDEPLSNLDAALRTEMRAELKKLHESLRGTFVYVTHDQAEAMTLADRLVVLSNGEVQQIAPPLEVYDRPANAFVARFFGLPPMQLVSPGALGFEGRESMHAGVRPEHLRLTDPGSADTVAARVYLVESMGSESWVTVDVAGERVVVRMPGRFAGRAGDAVGLVVDRGAIAWFDRERGTRVGA